MSLECLLEWDLARVRRHLYIRCNLITVAKFLLYVEVEELYVLVAFEEDGEVCTIPYSKILKDQVLPLDWFCTRPVSFSSFTYRENVCHCDGSILHAYSISTTCVYSILHAWYTHVQHTTCVYTHGVMLRVLLCKVCACGTRVSHV